MHFFAERRLLCFEGDPDQMGMQEAASEKKESGEKKEEKEQVSSTEWKLGFGMISGEKYYERMVERTYGTKKHLHHFKILKPSGMVIEMKGEETIVHHDEKRLPKAVQDQLKEVRAPKDREQSLEISTFSYGLSDVPVFHITVSNGNKTYTYRIMRSTIMDEVQLFKETGEDEFTKYDENNPRFYPNETVRNIIEKKVALLGKAEVPGGWNTTYFSLLRRALPEVEEDDLYLGLLDLRNVLLTDAERGFLEKNTLTYFKKEESTKSYDPIALLNLKNMLLLAENAHLSNMEVLRASFANTVRGYIKVEEQVKREATAYAEKEGRDDLQKKYMKMDVLDVYLRSMFTYNQVRDPLPDTAEFDFPAKIVAAGKEVEALLADIGAEKFIDHKIASLVTRDKLVADNEKDWKLVRDDMVKKLRAVEGNEVLKKKGDLLSFVSDGDTWLVDVLYEDMFTIYKEGRKDIMVNVSIEELSETLKKKEGLDVFAQTAKNHFMSEEQGKETLQTAEFPRDVKVVRYCVFPKDYSHREGKIISANLHSSFVQSAVLKKRYPKMKVEYIFSDNPLEDVRTSMQKHYAKGTSENPGCRHFMMSFFNHGSKKEVQFLNKVDGQGFADLAGAFEDAHFQLDSIACFGGGLAKSILSLEPETLQKFSDRFTAYLQAKGNTLNFVARTDVDFKDSPFNFEYILGLYATPYDLYLMKELLNTETREGDARIRADRKTKKAIRVNPSAIFKGKEISAIDDLEEIEGTV